MTIGLKSTQNMRRGPELMKLLRNHRLTVRQIAQSLDLSLPTAKMWVHEYAATGMLQAHKFARVTIPAKPGRAPMVYTVSTAWCGTTP